ncbi:hypothetical protein [Methanobrevibacter sp. AbM4]|uniref:hypothetical protein n=1 Tax=Methanobrevibacter sp. AbM4 TaxID=224719 RepID=UPI000694ACA3|nr:hypothetical protein [Methanobrevibacter sp. AbM4]
MEFLLYPILYGLSGFFMKISDDVYDEKHNKILASLIGILCGVVSGIITSSSVDGAYIFLGILIGNFIALKVDGIHHVVTLIVFLAVSLYLSIPTLNLLLLAVIIISALIDEIGNDNEKIYAKSKFLMYFFDYRFAMKVVILILALFGYLNLWTFLFFLCFEIAYEIGRVLFERYLINWDL